MKQDPKEGTLTVSRLGPGPRITGGLRRSLVRWLYGFGRHKPIGTPEQLGAKSEAVTFRSRIDAVELKGWFIPAEESDRAIIILHGGFMNRADPYAKALPLSVDLARNGFNVLAFDQRGSGESDGDEYGFGYWEWRDALGALDYLKERGFEAAKIGFHGFSTGAVIGIMAAARDPQVRALVSDGAFADLRELLRYLFVRQTHLPKPLSFPLLRLLEALTGIDSSAVSPEREIGCIKPRRILFIHGQKDEMVPPDHPGRLHHAANNGENPMWLVPDAGHVQAYSTRPTEYLSKVVTFFSEELA